MDLIKEAKNVFDNEISSLELARDNLDENFCLLVQEIQKSQGRVITTGMGKAGHIARKVASTMASLGTPSFFLHPAEGLHGDLGEIMKDDIVIVFSKSGETEEVLQLIPSIKVIGAKIVSVCCRLNSTLNNYADVIINLVIGEEASSNKLAPTSSTTAMLVFGDALGVVLEKLNGFSEEDFALFHPNGSLGKKLLLTVESIMVKGEYNPIIYENQLLRDAIIVMSGKGLGGANVVDQNGRFLGLVTDGDIRRLIEANQENVLDIQIKSIMNSNPIIINKNKKALDALILMEQREKPLSILPVIDDNYCSVGMIRIHDIIKAGVVL